MLWRTYPPTKNDLVAFSAAPLDRISPKKKYHIFNQPVNGTRVNFGKKKMTEF